MQATLLLDHGVGPAVERAPINAAPLDRWTTLHLATGTAMGLAGVPVWAAAILSVGFEVWENLLQPYFPSVFPNTAPRDSMLNAALDVIAVVAGCLVGQGVMYARRRRRRRG